MTHIYGMPISRASWALAIVGVVWAVLVAAHTWGETWGIPPTIRIAVLEPLFWIMSGVLFCCMWNLFRERRMQRDRGAP